MFGVLLVSVPPVAATLLVLLAATACCVLPPVLRVVEDAVEIARKELGAARETKDEVSATSSTPGDVECQADLHKTRLRTLLAGHRFHLLPLLPGL